MACPIWYDLFADEAFYSRLAEVKRGGLTAIGMCGDRLKGRNYAVLTVNDDGIVVHAEQFSGWTVFARLRQQPDIEGMSLAQLRQDDVDLPVSDRLRVAFRNAAEDLWKAQNGKPEEEEAIPANGFA